MKIFIKILTLVFLLTSCSKFFNGKTNMENWSSDQDSYWDSSSLDESLKLAELEAEMTDDVVISSGAEQPSVEHVELRAELTTVIVAAAALNQQKDISPKVKEVQAAALIKKSEQIIKKMKEVREVAKLNSAESIKQSQIAVEIARESVDSASVEVASKIIDPALSDELSKLLAYNEELLKKAAALSVKEGSKAKQIIEQSKEVTQRVKSILIAIAQTEKDKANEAKAAEPKALPKAEEPKFEEPVKEDDVENQSGKAPKYDSPELEALAVYIAKVRPEIKVAQVAIEKAREASKMAGDKPLYEESSELYYLTIKLLDSISLYNVKSEDEVKDAQNKAEEILQRAQQIMDELKSKAEVKEVPKEENPSPEAEPVKSDVSNQSGSAPAKSKSEDKDKEALEYINNVQQSVKAAVEYSNLARYSAKANGNESLLKESTDLYYRSLKYADGSQYLTITDLETAKEFKELTETISKRSIEILIELKDPKFYDSSVATLDKAQESALAAMSLADKMRALAKKQGNEKYHEQALEYYKSASELSEKAIYLSGEFDISLDTIEYLINASDKISRAAQARIDEMSVIELTLVQRARKDSQNIMNLAQQIIELSERYGLGDINAYGKGIHEEAYKLNQRANEFQDIEAFNKSGYSPEKPVEKYDENEVISIIERCKELKEKTDSVFSSDAFIKAQEQALVESSRDISKTAVSRASDRYSQWKEVYESHKGSGTEEEQVAYESFKKAYDVLDEAYGLHKQSVQDYSCEPTSEELDSIACVSVSVRAQEIIDNSLAIIDKLAAVKMLAAKPVEAAKAE